MGCRKNSESFRCVSEPLFDLKNECKSLPDVTIVPRIPPETHLGDGLKFPTYSSLNSGKIAYVRNVQELVVYDVGERVIDYESGTVGLITSKPDWGSNDMICFATLQSGQIHVFSPSTKQIESIQLGKARDLEWLNEEEVIFFQDQGKYGWHLLKYNYLSKELDTVLADVTDILTTSDSYNKKFGKILVQDHIDFKYFDLNTNTYHEGRYNTQEDELSFSLWHPFYHRVYYLQRDGLYYYDYSDQQEVRVKKNCDSWYYSSFDFSPDGERIMAVLHQKWMGKGPEGLYPDSEKDDWYYTNSHLAEFQLDGCNEQIVLEGESE